MVIFYYLKQIIKKMLSTTTSHTPILGTTAISSSPTLNPHNTSFSRLQTTSRPNPINITLPIPLSNRNPSRFSNLDSAKNYFLSFFVVGYGASLGLYTAIKSYNIINNFRQNNDRQGINNIEVGQRPPTVIIDGGYPEYQGSGDNLVMDNIPESGDQSSTDSSSPRPASPPRPANPSSTLLIDNGRAESGSPMGVGRSN
jgi:hypothetical protein